MMNRPREQESYKEQASSLNTAENAELEAAKQGHYIDTHSLKLFVNGEKLKQEELEKLVKLDSKNNSCSSSNYDNEEKLDKMSSVAIGDDNAKKGHGISDFLTPKKKGKNQVGVDAGHFGINNKEKYQDYPHSASRIKSKTNNPMSKSFSS